MTEPKQPPSLEKVEAGIRAAIEHNNRALRHGRRSTDSLAREHYEPEKQGVGPLFNERTKDLLLGVVLGVMLAWFFSQGV